MQKAGSVEKKFFYLFLTLPFIVFIVSRYHVIWQWPLGKMLSIYASDDMFYYLQIARNIADGSGVTFDKITTTNGFHPLYMLVLVICYKIFPFFRANDIQCSLSILSLIQGVTALFVYRIVKKCTDERPARLIGITVFLLHPFIFFSGLSGVESPLAVLFLAVSCDYYLSFRNGVQVSGKSALCLGVFLALAFLSRTDSIFIIAGILGDFLVYRVFIKKYSWKQEITALFLIGISFSLIVTPWFIWNLLRFGDIKQDSMKAILFWSHHSFKFEHPVITRGPSFFETLNSILIIIYLFMFNNNLFMLSLLGLFIFAAAIFMIRDSRSFKKSQTGLFLLFPVIMAGALWIFYFFYLRHWQLWYMISTMFLCSLFISVVFDRIYNHLPTRFFIKPFFLSGIMVLLSVFFFYYGQNFSIAGATPWQGTYFKIAAHVPLYVPKTVRIGSFNAGILSRFSDRTVINLDGVTNHEVLYFLKHGELLNYLKKRKIEYIVDSSENPVPLPQYTTKKVFELKDPLVKSLVILKVSTADSTVAEK